MASRGLGMGLAMVFMAMFCSRAMAQSSCTTTITSLAPCLNYITGNSSTPSSSCCSQLAGVVQSSPQCLCSVLNGGTASLGITINQTLALSLPGACNVKTPPVSQCNAANGPKTPATSPVGSPASSPGDADNYDNIPSGVGSKTVPSTDGTSSDGRIIRAPVHLVLFLLFIISSASAITRY